MIASHGWLERVRNPSRSARVLFHVVVLLGVSALSFALGHILAFKTTTPSGVFGEGATMLKSGPWGELDSVPMTIAPPIEILPVREMEAETPHWLFKGYSREELAQFLDSCDLPGSACDQLLSPAALHVVSDGLDLTPPREIIVSLSPTARRKIFTLLARFPKNWSQLYFFTSSSVDDRLREAAVSRETAALFQKLSCPYGKNTLLTSLPCLLAGIPTYDEKARLIKALTRQNTLLLRLHLKPDSNISELTSYWGKATWSTDVKAMLDSLAHVPGGTWIDVVEVLPPMPTALLYTYPIPDNPASGPPVQRDCHWTAFNFFRDPPDPQYANADYANERMKLDYFPIASDPRYGDIVFFTLPDATVVHSAVFLADDIVYTKNGVSTLCPWLLSTISELEEVYSFAVPPGQKIKVLYYRNKYL